MISFPAEIYLLKVNNRNTRTRCEICSKLTTNTPEQRKWHCSGVFIVNLEHMSHLAVMILLLALNKELSAGFSCLQIYVDTNINLKKTSKMKYIGKNIDKGNRFLVKS